MKEYRKQMSQNRSTLYHFFKDKLDLKYMKIGKGSYKVFRVPYDWESSFLKINDIRITDFQSVILYSNELVIRFSTFDDWQVNIPYRVIKTISLSKDLDIGYI